MNLARPDSGGPVKSLGKIVRSVQAFSRELKRAAVPPSSSQKLQPKIGLALGGGFARGIAHIGVLKVLEEEGIQVDAIAGTSVGALVGAAYCSGLSVADLEAVARRVRFRDFARWTLSRFGFATNQRMITFLHTVLKVRTFEELKIPLAVTATDFSTGAGIVFRSGGLIDPVRASCAYPGMFLPVNIDGRWCVDGMLAHPVPARPLRLMGVERVIAIHLKGTWSKLKAPRHVFDVIGQCFAIAQDMNSSLWRTSADLVVEPDVNGFEYDAFDSNAALIAAGETAMRAALPTVKRWLAVGSQRVGVLRPVASS